MRAQYLTILNKTEWGWGGVFFLFVFKGVWLEFQFIHCMGDLRVAYNCTNTKCVHALYATPYYTLLKNTKHVLLHICKWNAKHHSDVHNGDTVFFGFSTQIFDTTPKHSCTTLNWLLNVPHGYLIYHLAMLIPQCSWCIAS